MRAKHTQNLSLPLTSPVTLGSYNLSELWFPYFAKEGLVLFFFLGSLYKLIVMYLFSLGIAFRSN